MKWLPEERELMMKTSHPQSGGKEGLNFIMKARKVFIKSFGKHRADIHARAFGSRDTGRNVSSPPPVGTPCAGLFSLCVNRWCCPMKAIDMMKRKRVIYIYFDVAFTVCCAQLEPREVIDLVCVIYNRPGVVQQYFCPVFQQKRCLD